MFRDLIMRTRSVVVVVVSKSLANNETINCYRENTIVRWGFGSLSHSLLIARYSLSCKQRSVQTYSSIHSTRCFLSYTVVI